jgi:predicted PurR-regulated permease PerM
MESLVMQKTGNYKLFLLIAGLAVIYLLYLLGPIWTPFLAGALIAYLTAPAVHRLDKHFPHLLSVITVFVVTLFVVVFFILLLIPLMEKQIEQIPAMIDWFQKKAMPWLIAKLGLQEEINFDVVKDTLIQNISKTTGAAQAVIKTAVESGRTVIIWGMNLMLIPVVTFYLLRDWNPIIKNIRNLLPRSVEPTVAKLTKESDEVLSAFLRGQLLVMLGLGIIYSIGLSLVGLKVGVVIGLISGLLSIVPYLGFIVGIVAASLAAYIQFGTMTPVLLVWLVYAIGQAIEGSVLTPNLVGNRIGLHPVAVIFAVLTGGSLWGFFGVLLALPVAAVIMVLLRFVNKNYRQSRLYQ